MQLLIATSPGANFVLNLSDAEINVSQIKNLVEERCAIPIYEQRLVCNRKELGDHVTISEKEAETLPPIHVLLRIMGGKGGFGSLLRGGNTRVGQKKNTNFDACRDLSGRRLRHSQNEQRLAEWYSKEKERELETMAQKKAEKSSKSYSFDEASYSAELEKLEESVSSSVAVGLQELKENNPSVKRKREESKKETIVPSKKICSRFFEDSSDSDDSEEDNEEKEKKEKKSKKQQKEKVKKKKINKNNKNKNEVIIDNSEKKKLPPVPKWIVDEQSLTLTKSAA